MPALELTNEEYDRIMRERQPEHIQRTGYCEDYPCCGHTPDDPCGYQPYDNPQRMYEWAQRHSYCDHEAGIYECEEYGDDDD